MLLNAGFFSYLYFYGLYNSWIESENNMYKKFIVTDVDDENERVMWP